MQTALINPIVYQRRNKMYLLLLVLSFLGFTAPFRLVPSFDPLNRDSPAKDKLPHDLTDLIHPLSVQHSDIYDNALTILTEIQSSPSCHRLAASTLLNSCQTLDTPSSRAEESIEDLRSQYAAQLALCEISSAGSAVPHQCMSLVPTAAASEAPQASRTVKPSMSSHQKRQLGLCLKTLESRPQWWTSYSNNRQNAAVMCQATRVDIEKGE